MSQREQMNIVIVGHVDHGKSTVIGRMLSDTDSLPEGKLEQVKNYCKLNSREFEYAYLLDALKDEQSQGITIDSARCFFKSKKRDYIIIDAPGHIDFLKNMISGAARAESALLVIDAQEGVQENSKRHGYMLKMLGIEQVAVVINKMDLVDYKKSIFEKIKSEYNEFLKKIGIDPKEFIPVSGKKGDNVAKNTDKLSWFSGNTVLNLLDTFTKEPPLEDKPFRMPIQDIYKFTDKGDNRRIVAGRIESGTINTGEDVIFLPSNKHSKIKSIEEFNANEEIKQKKAGFSTGFTLKEQIYIQRGDIMCKVGDDLPKVSSLFRANIFWMGKNPLVKNKEYKLKLTTKSIPIKIKEIIEVLDASNLSNSKKQKVKMHEVAKCEIECASAIAFDTIGKIQSTSRFVIVDNFDISGGGIITESIEDIQSETRHQVFLREQKWEYGKISPLKRARRYSQKPMVILITGRTGVDKKSLAKEVERYLFESGRFAYFLGIGNLLRGLDADIDKRKREEHIRRLGEVSHILLDAGLIVIATASDLTDQELKKVKTIIGKQDLANIIIGKNGHKEEIDLHFEDDKKVKENLNKVIELLRFKNVIFNP